MDIIHVILKQIENPKSIVELNVLVNTNVNDSGVYNGKVLTDTMEEIYNKSDINLENLFKNIALFILSQGKIIDVKYLNGSNEFLNFIK